MKIYNYIKTLLEQNEKFCKDGKLFKNVVVEAGLKLDPDLLSILLSDETAKKYFFIEVNEVAVFDKVKFQKFVSNKQFLPDSYTAFKNKIGLTANSEYLTEANEVVLDFPYKDCVLEGGQTKEDQKRQEIFWNETLAPDEIDRLFEPKVLTNWKRYDKDGEHEVKNISLEDNLIIKGNNLIALHSLKKVYKGKVKLIYIDPPYNTGNDSFNYNDSFNHSTWLTFMKNRLEVAKELLTDDGVIFIQCDDNEQAYLKVMCDGVFGRNNFVKTLHIQMSNVQGEKVKAAKEGRIVKNGEYIHIYSRNGSKKIGLKPLYELAQYDTHYSIYFNEDNIESPLTEYALSNKEIKKLLIYSGILKDKGSKTKFTNKQLARAYEQLESFREFIQSTADRIVRTDRMVEIDGIDKSKLEENKVYTYQHNNGKKYLYGIDSKGGLKQRFRLSDKLKVCDDYYSTKGLSTMRGDWWSGFHVDLGNINKESNVHLDNGQKPERLIENILKFVTVKDDIVLDFHLGSGTTVAVAHKMGRRYIGVEQIENQMNMTCKRLGSVIKGDDNNISKKYHWQGGGSFVYTELAKDNEEILENIQKANDCKELINIWNDLKEKQFISYKIDPKDFDSKIRNFEELDLIDQKKVLVSFLDKNQLYINLSEIESKDHNVRKEDKNLTNKFYGKQ